MALVIEDGGFRLEQVELGSIFWDLYVRKKTTHKDGTDTIEWKVMKYGVPIESAINTIILARVSARHPEVLTLKEFFEDYKSERMSVIQAFSLQTVDLTKDLIELQKNGKEGKAITTTSN